MQINPNENPYPFSQADQEELDKLISILELSSRTTIIFAIAPESSPQHPVVEQLKTLLSASEDDFQPPENFFYSDNSLHNFLYSLDNQINQQTPQPGRKVILAFGIDQLPTPRLVREMKQLNLGRESLFGRELVLIFWLNQAKFLDEFRHRAPDFWDWRAKVVQFEARPRFNTLFYPYLEWLIAENSYLKISGVMQVQRQVDIFLDQIYVSLQAKSRQQVSETVERVQREVSGGWRQSGSKGRQRSSSLDDPEFMDDSEPLSPDFIPSVGSTKTVTQKVDLSQAIRENKYSVILGDPGAGKTTLLRYLALHFATAKRDDCEKVIGGEEQEELGAPLLPIFFRIADYAEQQDRQPDLSLLDYLRQFYRQWEGYFKTEAEIDAGTEIAELLLNAMRQGQCLMLLDGLDEVFDQESRRLIVKRIDEFVELFPANKFVITSRIAGYRDVKLSSRFAEFTIEHMAESQVEKFLHRWCRAVEKAQQPDGNEELWQRAGNQQAREILTAIKDNEGVKRLTANPLLLTILALIHRNGSRLPNRRVELYALAVKTLTEDWQLGKKLPDAPKVVLKETEVVELLAPLAYWMHEEKPSGVVTQAEVEEKLAEKLAELNDADPDSDLVRQAVAEFLRKVRETTGLFVERAPEVYGFMHLTFEEYFAARYIANTDEIGETLSLIDSHLHEPRWNEPILLALGYLSGFFPKRVNKLVEQLFSNLDAYEPAIQNGKIQIKNPSSADATIIWSDLTGELMLKDLLFAGRVLAEVEVNSSIRKKLINKLVLTFICLDADFDDDANKQLLRLMRQIEIFHQKGEVISRLQQAAKDSTISEETRLKVKLAILYVACGQPGAKLVSCAIDIVSQIEPDLFCSLRDLVAKLGEEMTDALETCLQIYSVDSESTNSLIFLTAMSYMRPKSYEKAIGNFQQLSDSGNSKVSAYIAWSLATCHQEKSEFDRAIDYYKECCEKLSPYIEPSAFLLLWSDRGVCHRLDGKYDLAIDCFHKMLTLARDNHKYKDEALALYHIGKAYKEWGKYEQALAYHQQSRDLYQQLGKDTNVANRWYNLAECYREWGKYQQALECELQVLAIRQQLDDQPNIANAYYQLGRIYQSWGKYEQALAYHQQSRDLYQQSDKDTNVANQWYNLAECYREWGKYEQALECELQDLAIRQQLDDQPRIALAYYQLGRIYQNWGKYEQALAYYQQSRDLYQQLAKDTNVANQWYWLAVCYREWGKYQQALECELQDLAIRQQLDDQPKIAEAYFQLGRIYQNWGKYEQALAYYQQSRDLYQQLAKDSNVANLWYWLAECYREWGKYQQAVECELQDLAIRQQLDDQPRIALAYYQLGRIYQSWGKYEQALAYHQQSRDLYQQSDKDTNVANQWYNLAECYREWGKYEQALECELQDLAIRQQLDDQPRIALAYYQLGRIYQSWGKYEQALAYHQQSRDLYQQLGKDSDVAALWYNLAECYREWGKYQQALECELQDLAIRQQLDDQPRIALAYYQLGRIYQSWGKYEQALAYHQQSRKLYQQLGKDSDVAALWYNLAECYREWGKYQQAVECELQDLAIRQQLDDQPRIALAYYQLGRIYQSWGKYEQALAYHQQSRKLNQQLGKDTNVAALWYNLAECYREWGKYEQALECELQDLAIRQQLDDQPRIAEAYYQLGRIYQNWGKYEQALAYYQQSRDLYQQLAKDTNVANQWYWLAVCYREWGKYQQALECELQDLAIRQQLDDQPRIALAYYQLGRIYQNWGKYEQALAYYQQSRDLYQQLAKDTNVANQWYWLAECYREWGKYQQALECELQDLAIRQQLDDQPRIAEAYYQLGRIYQSWGKYEQALAYYQQSRDLYQQLAKDSNVANLWYWLAECYREWGKYQQAVECELQDLAIRQQLDDQPRIALAYYQLGRIYQSWGKYEQALAYHQQSRDLYQQSDKDTNVANQWYNLAECYREWGKYEQALECELQDLAIRQQLDDQPRIALAYYQLGRIYQSWGKYEQALAYHQQSRDLYQQSDKDTNVANQWYNLAECYREWGKYQQALECELQDLAIRQQLDDQPRIAEAYYQLGRIYQNWGKYEQALAYHQQSRDLYQQLEQNQSVARSCRQIANSQRLLAKNSPDRTEALNLLAQAEQNIRQAIKLNTEGEYKEDLAYDNISLALLWSERLRLSPCDTSNLQAQIAQFEEYYRTGLTYLTELGETVNRADESLDISRVYLEINPLENLALSEEIAQESLQVFQEYNRRKLEASARKLLGEIHLKRSQQEQLNADTIATQFLTESLEIYRELDLQEKVAEVEQLIDTLNLS